MDRESADAPSPRSPAPGLDLGGTCELDGLAELALAKLPAAALVIDPDGEVVYANEVAAKILERPVDMLVARPISELLGIDAAAIEARVDAKLGDAEAEIEVLLPSTRKITVGLSTGTLAWSGRTHRSIVFQDVSGLAELRRQRDRLVQLAAVGDVLPAILHELKNPLAAVTASVEVLLEELEEGDARTMLHAVLGEVRRMKLAFDGVGAVGRSLRASRHGAIDLACREAFRVLEPRAASAGIIMRADVADLPLLPFDPAVVRALVFNLVKNAIHASTALGTIYLHVHLVERGSALEIQVIDNGSGMSADVLSRCTELFFTTKRNGSGIGLALCKQSVEDAGGTLDIASVPGTGTRVTLHLPIAQGSRAGRSEGSQS